ncbi:hypothetical protein STANM309S_00955 [Streptomyces tanashiensis]
MTTSRSTYHHGELRQAVLAAALDVIATDGPGALSLRDLARRAGVSHAAPAHHFKDRTGLLTAIATQGYELLAAGLAGTARLRERGVRYVRFAVEHPAHFQASTTCAGEKALSRFRKDVLTEPACGPSSSSKASTTSAAAARPSPAAPPPRSPPRS